MTSVRPCVRQARAVHGAHEGTWYYEVTMEHLGASGHVRLGWSTRNAELQTPVRFTGLGPPLCPSCVRRCAAATLQTRWHPGVCRIYVELLGSGRIHSQMTAARDVCSSRLTVPSHRQVGYDAHSYAYRDLEGSKVHRALREPYGQGFGEGDVVGCLLHLPPGGRPFETRSRVSVAAQRRLDSELSPPAESLADVLAYQHAITTMAPHLGDGSGLSFKRHMMRMSNHDRSGMAVLSSACEPAQDLVTYKNEVYVKEEDAKPAPLPGSLVAFSVNGTSQGVAYRHVALSRFPRADAEDMSKSTP